jgi:hypothetical protein
VGSIYDATEYEREDTTVTLRAQVTRAQAELVLGAAAGFSRELAKKTPEEIEQMKRRRIEAMKARKGGKLPPSALDPEPEQPDPEAGQPKPTPTPTTPATGNPAPAKPNKTPTQDGASGSVPG